MNRIERCVPFLLFSALVAQGPTWQRNPAVSPTPEAPATTRLEPALSAVLLDQPRADGPLWAIGHDWKAAIDGTGFSYVPFFGSQAPRNFPLRIELAQVSVGGEPLALVPGTAVGNGARVTTDRGGLTEQLDLELRAVEQSFVFAQLPNRGAVRIDLRLQGEFLGTATGDGVAFANAHGSVGYRKALAVDAAGAVLALPIAWDGSLAHIEIPAEFVRKAQLPLVLDPILNTNPGLAPAQAQYQRSPDLATIQGPTRNCVVWKRQWSATDQDCWAVLTDGSLVTTASPIAIDFSDESWEHVAVAGVSYARSFLVVSQVDQGGVSWIGGRLITASGLTGLEIDIERSGVVGHPGMNYRPDVGGDPFAYSGARFTVVWEHETGPGDRDIYYKQVQSNGLLVTSMPSLIVIDTRNETHPSISKSCRAFGTSDRWTVAWQRSNFAFTDEDVVGAQIDPVGYLVQGPYGIATSAAMETLPQASSLANIDGANYHAVVFQLLNGGQNDIACHIVGDSGALFSQGNLSQMEALGLFQSRNQIFPDVDSDGVRFAIGYSEFTGSDYNTLISTVAFEPSNNSLRIDDERVLLGATAGVDDYWTAICAEFSGSNQASPRYFVAGANIGANDLAVWDYGGFVPGQYYTPFGSQCGNLPISASGIPALGNRISFSLATSNLSGFVMGFPGLQGLGVCSCLLGVAYGVTVPNPHVWQIPNSPSLVNLTLSVQGWSFGGSACLGAIDLSHTLDFVIR